MKHITEITYLQCELCHKQFKISNYQSIQKAKQACIQHQKTCKGIPKINIGDIVIFKDFDNITNNNEINYWETPPLYIKKIIRSNKDLLQYYCTFVQIDLQNNTYYEDKLTTKNWFKNNEDKYFIFNQYQIDRKLNMQDLIKVNNQMNLIKQKLNLYIQYSDRNTNIEVKPIFKENKIKMIIEVPYKTER